MTQQENSLTAGLVITALAWLLPPPFWAQTDPHAAHHSSISRQAMLSTPQSIAAEHRELHDVLARASREAGRLGTAARRPDYVRFSDDLAAHARQKEEILYPAAVLVGRYVACTAPIP